MHSYIIIHHTSDVCQIALFINNKLINSVIEDKRNTSKMLIFHIDALLKGQSLTLTDISFIGINQGPGLFSTLRSIIATVNALHCASNIPIIGVDALEVTAHEFYDPSYDYSIVLLDAFNHEIYYAIMEKTIVVKKGYDNIETFLKNSMETYPETDIRFIGKGTYLYKDIIKHILKDHAIISDDIPLICTLEAVAIEASNIFAKNKSNGFLFPLYLKKHPVEL